MCVVELDRNCQFTDLMTSWITVQEWQNKFYCEEKVKQNSKFEK